MYFEINTGTKDENFYVEESPMFFRGTPDIYFAVDISPLSRFTKLPNIT